PTKRLPLCARAVSRRVGLKMVFQSGVALHCPSPSAMPDSLCKIQEIRAKIRALIRRDVFVAKDTSKRQALFAPVAFPMCYHAASSGGAAGAAPNTRLDHLAEVREDRNGCAPGGF